MTILQTKMILMSPVMLLQITESVFKKKNCEQPRGKGTPGYGGFDIL